MKRVANDVENSLGKGKRCHSGRRIAEAKLFVTKVDTLLLRIHPGNRDEVFIWQNFPARLPRFRLENRGLGNRARPPSHMNTSKILQRI